MSVHMHVLLLLLECGESWCGIPDQVIRSHKTRPLSHSYSRLRAKGVARFTADSKTTQYILRSIMSVFVVTNAYP